VILARAQSVLDAALHPMPACGGNTAPAALAAALEAFASTGNFRDAVLSAANLGGNSDVVAAACGALAGAHYTASAIPTLWRNSLIKEAIDREQRGSAARPRDAGVHWLTATAA